MFKKSNVSSILNILLAVTASAAILFAAYKLLGEFGVINSRGGLSVDVIDGEASVYLNDDNIGTTPITSYEAKAGENVIKVENDSIAYETEVDFLVKPGRTFEVALIRDLGVSEVFSSGINLWFEENSSDTVLSVISEPSEASVYIDNSRVGATPFSTSELTPGEYSLRVMKTGYEPQMTRVTIDKDYQLNVSTKLFPKPVPTTVNTLPDSANIYDIPSDNSLITSDTKDWVDAIIHWNQTRGIELNGVGLNKELVFDYFVDYKGNIYDSEGTKLVSKEELGTVQRGAYLRRISEGTGLSDLAKQALEDFEIVGGQTATINYTGTGWLNVRSTPSLNSDVLTKVDVGDSFAVLEQSNDWVKIKVSATTEGWVSGTYVTISEQ